MLFDFQTIYRHLYNTESIIPSILPTNIILVELYFRDYGMMAGKAFTKHFY